MSFLLLFIHVLSSFILKGKNRCRHRYRRPKSLLREIVMRKWRMKINKKDMKWLESEDEKSRFRNQLIQNSFSNRLLVSYWVCRIRRPKIGQHTKILCFKGIGEKESKDSILVWRGEWEIINGEELANDDFPF